jgi:hypothetical protein
MHFLRFQEEFCNLNQTYQHVKKNKTILLQGEKSTSPQNTVHPYEERHTWPQPMKLVFLTQTPLPLPLTFQIPSKSLKFWFFT